MKKSLYLKYLEQQKHIGKKSDEEIRGSDFFMPKIKTLFKISYYILLSVLVSIGLTAIINPSIREIFINLVKGGFSL